MLPVLVHQLAELAVVAALQRRLAPQAEFLHVMQILQHLLVILLGLPLLRLQDRRGAARKTGEEQQEAIFQFVQRVDSHVERPSLDSVIGIECEAGDPPNAAAY